MKRFLLVFFILVFSLMANCDYLIKTKKGYRFSCGKILYTKKQVKEINSKLYKTKCMPLKLHDRKVFVKFNHFKVLSITQRLNSEQLELVSRDW